MTETKLRSLVDAWMGRLGLDKWDIRVEIGGADDDCSAMTQRSRNYDAATIHFQPWMAGLADLPTDWPGRPWDDTEIEKTIVHELLHCCLRDMHQTAITTIENQLHRDVFSVWETSLARAEEQVVDRLAKTLVGAWGRGHSQ